MTNVTKLGKIKMVGELVMYIYQTNKKLGNLSKPNSHYLISYQSISSPELHSYLNSIRQVETGRI